MVNVQHQALQFIAFRYLFLNIDSVYELLTPLHNLDLTVEPEEIETNVYEITTYMNAMS